MILLLQSGRYQLAETRRNTKILYLDTTAYAWVEPAPSGEILVATHKPHKTDCTLSVGTYQLYRVIEEPTLSDHIHLELEVGRDQWQGYLLLTGLPAGNKLRSQIIPTAELITGRISASPNTIRQVTRSPAKAHNHRSTP